MSFICIGCIPGFECKQLGGFRNLSAGKQPRTSYSGNLVQQCSVTTFEEDFGRRLLEQLSPATVAGLNALLAPSSPVSFFLYLEDDFVDRRRFTLFLKV
jgi:hypothetical protein